jgi:predicted neutral ceramidase superfamily lipid hydrolase
MKFLNEIIKRLPAAAIGVCAATTSTGITLSIILVMFDGAPLYAVQLATFILALALVMAMQFTEKLNIGLPITRHEMRLVAIASVVSTWVIALLAILASQRHLNSDLNWPVHLTIQLVLALALPFAIRCLSGWYARTFWADKVSNALKSAGMEPLNGPNIEAAAKNYALPETLAWAISGAWAIGTVLGNMSQTAEWGDGTIYSAVVVTMTTFSMAYYYSHPDQQRLRSLIKSENQ